MIRRVLVSFALICASCVSLPRASAAPTIVSDADGVSNQQMMVMGPAQFQFDAQGNAYSQTSVVWRVRNADTTRTNLTLRVVGDPGVLANNMTFAVENAGGAGLFQPNGAFASGTPVSNLARTGEYVGFTSGPGESRVRFHIKMRLTPEVVADTRSAFVIVLQASSLNGPF